MVTARDYRHDHEAAVVRDERSPLERRLAEGGMDLSAIVLRAVDRGLADARSPRRLICTLSQEIGRGLIASFIATGMIRAEDDHEQAERLVHGRVVAFLAYRGLYTRDERSPEAMLALAVQHATTTEARDRIRKFIARNSN